MTFDEVMPLDKMDPVHRISYADQIQTIDVLLSVLREKLDEVTIEQDVLRERRQRILAEISNLHDSRDRLYTQQQLENP